MALYRCHVGEYVQATSIVINFEYSNATIVTLLPDVMVLIRINAAYDTSTDSSCLKPPSIHKDHWYPNKLHSHQNCECHCRGERMGPLP